MREISKVGGEDRGGDDGFWRHFYFFLGDGGELGWKLKLGVVVIEVLKLVLAG